MGDHYRPWSKMFPKKLRLKIAVSTIGVLLSWAVIYRVAREYGALSVWLWYGGPLMWNQAWLVLYTWLQHNDPSVPQYGPDQWTWVKGALYNYDPTPWYKAMWRVAMTCHYIDDVDGTQYQKSLVDVPFSETRKKVD